MPSLKQNESAVIVLRKAKELIETKGWCTHSYAINAHGESTFNPTPECSAFCLSGALIAVAGRGPNVARAILQKVVDNTDLSFWNDQICVSKEQCLGELDHAIALAESQS